VLSDFFACFSNWGWFVSDENEKEKVRERRRKRWYIFRRVGLVPSSSTKMKSRSLSLSFFLSFSFSFASSHSQLLNDNGFAIHAYEILSRRPPFAFCAIELYKEKKFKLKIKTTHLRTTQSKIHDIKIKSNLYVLWKDLCKDLWLKDFVKLIIHIVFWN